MGSQRGSAPFSHVMPGMQAEAAAKIHAGLRGISAARLASRRPSRQLISTASPASQTPTW